ncbi:arginine repressor [uncultured Bifidobacterium sp.]|uniref:arginine repressor n=1 Tax=uncultured Bifidobacterium sp. TaxID=165187 RepID=UPI0028DC4991|nr:arginine repressor [uncultured Bifidobacterium sp.]
MSSSPMQRPATRAARLSAIEEALGSSAITSQSQLALVLAAQGIEVTQATLSRDLDEMNATKTRLADGTVAYVLAEHRPGEGVAERALRIEQRMSRVISGLVTSVATARNLVVVHTPSGAAQYVASVIDRQSIEGILGTIAGDDTVMMVCSDDEVAADRAQWLLDIASGAAPSSPAGSSSDPSSMPEA